MVAQNAAARAVLVRLTQELEEMSNPEADIELQIQCIRAVNKFNGSEPESDRDVPITAVEHQAVAKAVELAQTLRVFFDSILAAQ